MSRPCLGSPVSGGNCSLASNSDWRAIRTGPSSGSTSYRIAATARWVNDTSRAADTRTHPPAGETHSARRLSSPDRKSSIRSCERSVPYRTSNGSSSTNSLISLPLVTLTTVCPDCGTPYEASVGTSGRLS